MTLTPEYERGFSSTRWVAERGRLTSSARGKRQQGRRPYRWFGLPRVRTGTWVTLRIKYTAGAECGYFIEARGRRGAVSGVYAIHDVMREVMQLD